MNIFKKLIEKYKAGMKELEEENRIELEKRKIVKRNKTIYEYYRLERTNSLKICFACSHQESVIYRVDGLYSGTDYDCELKSPFFSSERDVDCSSKCRYFSFKESLKLGKKYLEEDMKYLDNKNKEEHKTALLESQKLLGGMK